MKYNKLVRDKIPEIILSNGEKPIIKMLNDEEYSKALFKKLEEEYNEVLNATSRENLTYECADLLEVIFAILKLNNISEQQLLSVRDEKRLKRGGFENRIFLERVENN